MSTSVQQLVQQARPTLTKPPARKREPLSPEDIKEWSTQCQVLAFDQTLSHCGMALVSAQGGVPLVRFAGELRPQVDPALTSFERTYAKALALRGLLREPEPVTAMACADIIVYEMPAVGGYRTESSLLAGYVVRQFAHESGLPVAMVSNTSMRALIAPVSEGKAPIARAIDALVPEGRRYARSWNEHVRDAVGLALTHLHKQQEHTA